MNSPPYALRTTLGALRRELDREPVFLQPSVLDGRQQLGSAQAQGECVTEADTVPLPVIPTCAQYWADPAWVVKVRPF